MPRTMKSPGARRAAAWGTENVLKCHRALTVFLSVIPRTRKARFSAAPRTLSDPSSKQPRRPSHRAEDFETATGCGCSQHEQCPKPGQGVDSPPSVWLIALAASILLIGMIPQPACAVPVWATVIAAFGAAVTMSLVIDQL